MNLDDQHYIEDVVHQALRPGRVNAMDLRKDILLRLRGPAYKNRCIVNRTREGFRIYLLIPHVTPAAIEVEVVQGEHLRWLDELPVSFDEFNNSYATREFYWVVQSFREIFDRRLVDDLLYTSYESEDKKCKCGANIPVDLVSCIPCAELAAFTRNLKIRQRNAVNILHQICLTVGAVLWESVDDTSKRFMMLDFTPSKLVNEEFPESICLEMT